jgi:hypothetical protein
MRRVIETQVKYGSYSKKTLKCLLKALAANAGLNYEEMVGAYPNRNVGISNGVYKKK